MSNSRSAFISVIGRPNVGKSSFLNAVLGQKISIVSSKPQTTRTKIMGVYTKDNDQIVFIDTPGFHKPRNLLDENMNKAVGSGLCDIDASLLIVEASPKFKIETGELPPAEAELIKILKSRKIPTVLCINKIDLLDDKSVLLEVIDNYSKFMDFVAIVPFSAKTRDGIDGILKEASAFLKPSIHYFPDDEITDQPDRVMVSELIREKALRSLQNEIPHGIAIDLERFYERDNKNGEPILEVNATIYCEKESHKGIIIGKGGVMLKKIGSDARREIERFFGIPCNLQLWVKVKEDWRNRQGIIHTFGLDID